MEAIEFWVLIGKKLGLSLDDFQDIKNISLKNYKNIQDRLNDAQNCLRSGKIKNQSDINYIENYLTRLGKAVYMQESFILLKSLKILLGALESEVQQDLRRPRIKVLICICKKLKKRLYSIQNTLIDQLIDSAVQELCNYQYILLGKL